MSRATLPRIAPRTRPPKPRPAKKFPPLPIGIYHDGELVRVVEITDPRNGFMRSYNELAAKFGNEARPVAEGVKHG